MPIMSRTVFTKDSCESATFLGWNALLRVPHAAFPRSATFMWSSLIGDASWKLGAYCTTFHRMRMIRQRESIWASRLDALLKTAMLAKRYGARGFLFTTVQ